MVPDQPPLRAAAFAVVATLWLLGGCGDGGGVHEGDGAGGESVGGAAPAIGANRTEAKPSTGGQPIDTVPAAGEDQARIVGVVHRYVDAIDAADGAAVCGLLAPGALRR